MDAYNILSLVIACISVFFTGVMFVYDVMKNKAKLTLQAYGAGSCGCIIRFEILNSGNRVAKNIKIKNISINNNAYNTKKIKIYSNFKQLEPFDLAPNEYYSRDIGETDGFCDVALCFSIKYKWHKQIKRTLLLQNNKMTLNGIANELCHISTGIEKISKDKEDNS